jgi:hypothetical protein
LRLRPGLLELLGKRFVDRLRADQSRESDSSRVRADGWRTASAAIVCGMPLPWLPGKKRNVSQRSSAKPSGVTTNGAQGSSSTISWILLFA